MPLLVSKSKFKAKALEIFRTIEQSGEPVIITDRGKPTLEVRPYIAKNQRPLDLLRDTVIDFQQATDPVGEEDWDAIR